MNDDSELIDSQAIATFQYGANFKVIGKCDPQNLSYVGAFRDLGENKIPIK